MTETAPLGSVSRLPSDLAGAPTDACYAWRARQGRPAPLVEIRGRGEDGTLVPWDDHTMGELEVRGPWVAAAYYPGDEATDRWTDDGWFRTGDIVTIAASGSLSIQDRAKDLVKSGGEWISTVALESALVEHPGVSEAVVVAVPHACWGERPLAVIVPKPGCAPTIDDLRTHLAPRMPRWWLPDARRARREPAAHGHGQVPEEPGAGRVQGLLRGSQQPRGPHRESLRKPVRQVRTVRKNGCESASRGAGGQTHVSQRLDVETCSLDPSL